MPAKQGAKENVAAQGKQQGKQQGKGKALQPAGHEGAVPAAALAVEASVPYLEVPREEEDWRYTQSFAPDGANVAEARAFFEQYGFCVFRDVLTPDETAASCREVLSYAARSSEGFDPAVPSTWRAWRSKTFGMPPNDATAWWQPQLARNRRHPRVAACFATLMRVAPETLRCNHDRWALYHLGVRTRRNVHLDISPWEFSDNSSGVVELDLGYKDEHDLLGGAETNRMASAANGPHLQGTIALAPNMEHDAGFLCVPGSHRAFDAWVRALGPAPSGGTGPRYDYPAHAPYTRLAQRVPVRAGSLIVWDVRLAHGSQPDQSPAAPELAYHPRIVQFVTLRTQQLYRKEACRKRADLVRRCYAAHGLQEPTDPVERAVAGLVRGTAAGVREAGDGEGEAQEAEEARYDRVLRPEQIA